MKVKGKYLIFMLLSFSIVRCTIEERGQYPIHTESPQELKEVWVENMPGAVRITYDLPDETDLLYVQAKYELPNGKLQIEKSSVFKDFMILRGFARSKKSTIILTTVDRNRNESNPIEIEVEPLDSPIYDIIDSMSVSETFGGISLQWTNPYEEQIMIGVIKKDEGVNDFEQIENFYSSAPDVNRAVRGMDSTLVTIGVFCRDVFMNFTDTVIYQIKPLFEEEVPKSNFIPFSLPSFVSIQSSISTLDKIWDGNIYDETNYNFLYIKPGNEHLPFFSFDMGDKAKLSRFKLWPRLRYAFELHSPKEWEWWGTNDKNLARDSETINWEDNEGWVKLIECESSRPSGLEEGTPLTTEDSEYIEAGEDFEFSDEVPSVRYLRFKLIKSWSNGDGINLQEVQFWGQIQK